MSNNEDAGGSRVPVDPVEDHPYFSMLVGQHFGDQDEVDPTLHDEGGDAGNESTTSAAGDGNATSGSEAKRHRKERRPNKLSPIRDEITEVHPASGLPTQPIHVVKGYDNNIRCIL